MISYEESKAAYVSFCNSIIKRTRPSRFLTREESQSIRRIKLSDLKTIDHWYPLYTHVHAWPFENPFDEPR